jgi:antitoxin YefM
MLLDSSLKLKVSHKQEAVMAITTSEACRSLARLIERVNADRTEVEIVSKHGSAVLMSQDEYDSLVETSYLLSSPVNAHRLMSAVQSVRDR